MTNRPSSLALALEQERTQSFLTQAELIRNWQEGPERAEQAKRMIRQALVEWATGKISQEAESRVYAILDFAMPGPCESADDRQVAAYRQQLARQQCVECGDGTCPTGD